METKIRSRTSRHEILKTRSTYCLPVTLPRKSRSNTARLSSKKLTRTTATPENRDFHCVSRMDCAMLPGAVTVTFLRS
eukprot:scaffold1807_cov127-Skeletonema_marinoi.AAC.4